MTIGYTTTRSGLPLIELPETIQYQSSTFGPLTNDAEFTSRFTNSIQTLELPGQAWAGSITIGRNERNCCDKEMDDLFRDTDVFLNKLRGSTGRFRFSDPTWRAKCGTLGSGKFSACDKQILPKIEGESLYPHPDHFPFQDHWPTAGYFEEYEFKLTYEYDYSGDIVISENANAGDTCISVNSIDVQPTLINSNEWDNANGIRPGYEEAYTQALINISGKINTNSENELLLRADYIQIEDQLVKLTKNFESGDRKIYFEPPLRRPTSAGTSVNYLNPTCIVRMLENYAYTATTCGKHEPMTMKFREAIE